MWHDSREVWACPTTSDVRAAIYHQTGPLAWFLFPNAPTPRVSDEDACPYCSELAEDIFDNAGEDINECSADWGIHVGHLEKKHSFGKCDPKLVFYREDLFMLHLAGCHGLKITELMGHVVASCKRRSRSAAEVLDVSAVDDDSESL